MERRVGEALSVVLLEKATLPEFDVVDFVA